MRILPILPIFFLSFCIGYTSSSANDDSLEEKVKKVSLSKENNLKEQMIEEFIKPELVENIRKSEALPYQWLDEEVLEIKNLKEATETLINEKGKWSDSKNPCPYVVRYFEELNENDLPTILKWLRLKNLEYFNIVRDKKYVTKSNITNEEQSIILDWYDENKENQDIYKLIWMSYSGTIDALKYQGLDLLPPECIKAHESYYKKFILPEQDDE